MKLNTLEEQIALITAEHAGKEVQAYHKHLSAWLEKPKGRWDFDIYTYRVKPAMQLINGMECPLPLEEIEKGRSGYVPSFSFMQGFFRASNYHPNIDRMLASGFVYATPEDALTVRDALLNYKRGE